MRSAMPSQLSRDPLTVTWPHGEWARHAFRQWRILHGRLVMRYAKNASIASRLTLCGFPCMQVLTTFIFCEQSSHCLVGLFEAANDVTIQMGAGFLHSPDTA